MEIRFAKKEDIDDILNLLKQVNLVHHLGRPDIFKIGTKYTSDELEEIINDNTRPIFCYVKDNHVLGYAFTIIKESKGDNILVDRKELYIDDLCVDENARRLHIGEAIFNAVKDYAKNNSFNSITLNVWACNDSARRFYEKMGLIPLKTYLEYTL